MGISTEERRERRERLFQKMRAKAARTCEYCDGPIPVESKRKTYCSDECAEAGAKLNAAMSQGRAKHTLRPKHVIESMVLYAVAHPEMSITRLAVIFGVSRSTLSCWMSKYRAGKPLSSTRGRGKRKVHDCEKGVRKPAPKPKVNHPWRQRVVPIAS